MIIIAVVAQSGVTIFIFKQFLTKNFLQGGKKMRHFLLEKLCAFFLLLFLTSCGGGGSGGSSNANNSPNSPSGISKGTYTGNMIMKANIYDILNNYAGEQTYQRQVIVKIQPPITVSGKTESNPFNLVIRDATELPLAAGQIHITSAESLIDTTSPTAAPWLQQTWEIQETSSNFTGKLNDPLTAQDPSLATLGFNTFITPRDEGPIGSPMRSWILYPFNMASGKTTITGSYSGNQLTIHIEGVAIYTTGLDSPRQFSADITATLTQ